MIHKLFLGGKKIFKIEFFLKETNISTQKGKEHISPYSRASTHSLNIPASPFSKLTVYYPVGSSPLFCSKLHKQINNLICIAERFRVFAISQPSDNIQWKYGSLAKQYRAKWYHYFDIADAACRLNSFLMLHAEKMISKVCLALFLLHHWEFCISSH